MQLQEVSKNEGFDAMHKLFQEIAFGESDCGSHEVHKYYYAY